MTLLIGVLCSDGAVIAADRQASHGSLGTMTVGQPVTKITTVGPDLLFASSGRIGMSQQFEAFIKRLSGETYFAKNDYAIAIGRVQQHFRPIVEGAFKTATAASQIVGQQAAQSDCICASILAAPFRDGMKIVEISPQIAVEFLTPELSFLSMGSGKLTADPFLGFLKNVFWPDRLPTVREGALAAYWTIKLATDLRVSGVGMGIDICTLEGSDDGWASRKLEDNETAEHDGFIESCEDALRSVAAAIAGKSPATDIAQPIPVPEP
jgi:20S proteasome alpha/beta subunit